MAAAGDFQPLGGAPESAQKGGEVASALSAQPGAQVQTAHDELANSAAAEAYAGGAPSASVGVLF